MTLDDLRDQLRELPWKRLSIGYVEFHFVDPDRLDEKQTGYRVGAKGLSLIGKDGAWEKDWFVFGWSDSGDPFFTDVATGRVYTAIHGQGLWEPECVATNLNEPAQIMRRPKDLSDGREYPSGLEQNPLTAREIQKFSEFAVKSNSASDAWNWEMWVKQE